MLYMDIAFKGHFGVSTVEQEHIDHVAEMEALQKSYTPLLLLRIV